jgi:hypothetical protein
MTIFFWKPRLMVHNSQSRTSPEQLVNRQHMSIVCKGRYDAGRTNKIEAHYDPVGDRLTLMFDTASGWYTEQLDTFSTTVARSKCLEQGDGIESDGFLLAPNQSVEGTLGLRIDHIHCPAFWVTLSMDWPY